MNMRSFQRALSSGTKKPVYHLFILVALATSLSWKPVPKTEAPVAPRERQGISMCGNFSLTEEYLTAPIRLMDGLGDLHYPIETSDSMAQKYFDQGLRLVYAFNHMEALRSFMEASRLDPNSPMTYWGQALALGPNINDLNPGDRETMAYEAISNARKLASGKDPKEIDFINALSARYDGKVHLIRDSLNVAYMLAMESLSKKYPNDQEAKVLYADAIMNSIPWDYWDENGSPKPATTKAKEALEDAMGKFPSHPGAHHMYIHLVEASPNPGDAFFSAVFLENAMPKAGHIVHMPSHIFVRVGEYERANVANRKAITVDEAYLAEAEEQGLYRGMYYPHNIDFLVFGSMMTGQFAQSYREASKLAYHIFAMEKDMPVYFDYFMAMPVITYVRFGAWNEILALPPADTRYYQISATHHFARGMAFLGKDMVAEAEAEFRSLESINEQDTLKSIYAFFNSTHQITNVATHILKGELLIKQGKRQDGIAALQQAVAAEDTMRYNEPPDWRLPARHFLGAALIDEGEYEAAERVFEADLVRNPENGWALKGLWQSQLKQGKADVAVKSQQRFEKVWKQADVSINSSKL